VRAGRDLLEPRNLAVVALTIVLGIGGMEVVLGPLQLKGIGLAGVAGVLLNLFLPGRPKEPGEVIVPPAPH
jgi:uracil permease